MVENMPVKKGDRIKVEYEGKLADGMVFDSSEDGGPLEFVVGAGEVIQGFEDAVIGMEVGEDATVTLEPIDAYGEPAEDLIVKIPKEQFPDGLEVDTMVLIEDDAGKKFPAQIVAIDKETVTFDLNHPLAGKQLTFSIRILEMVGEE